MKGVDKVRTAVVDKVKGALTPRNFKTLKIHTVDESPTSITVGVRVGPFPPRYFEVKVTEKR